MMYCEQYQAVVAIQKQLGGEPTGAEDYVIQSMARREPRQNGTMPM